MICISDYYQVLAIPAVRPYVDTYLRRVRVISEHCRVSSPVTSRATTPTTDPHQRDNVHAGNDVMLQPEVGADPATCARGPDNDEKRTFVFIVLALLSLSSQNNVQTKKFS